MGAERGDICLGLASPSEFRTEPLMGLRLMKSFMHDGKAKSIEQAIDLHAGEGEAVKRRFSRLTPPERAAVLRFLGSL